MGEAVKNEAKTEQPAGDEEGQQPMPTLTKGGGGRGSVRITSSSTTATRVSSTSPQKIIVSGQKSAMSNEQLEMIEVRWDGKHGNTGTELEQRNMLLYNINRKQLFGILTLTYCMPHIKH
jgi:hypothetical protein